MVRTWRFNNLILAEKYFRDFLTSQIEYILTTNNTDDLSKSILWESLKAYCHNKIILYSAAAYRRRVERIFSVIDQILDLDHCFSVSPTPNLYKEQLAI